MTAADDLRALTAAATPAPWECNDGQLQTTKYDVGVIWSPEGKPSPDAELIVALRNRAAAIVDLADAVKAVPRHRYPDEKTGTCYRCFLPWPCPTERAHRALDALEATDG